MMLSLRNEPNIQVITVQVIARQQQLETVKLSTKKFSYSRVIVSDIMFILAELKNTSGGTMNNPLVLNSGQSYKGADQ